jgi:hypothetical protein
MRSALHRILVAAAALATTVASAQTHKVAKTEQVVRAVGVYEWTGDFAKPTASRLIPVSLFIESKFQDAGVYIARPIPFALLPGNLYILQAAGIDKGTLDLAYAKHLQGVEATGDSAFDDGWFGYGSVKPLAAPRKTAAALKPSKTLPVITASSTDPNRPHLVTKTSGDPASANASSNDQGKPGATQPGGQTNSPSSGKPDATASGTASQASSDESDRPTMKRRDSSSSSSGSSTTSASSGSTNGGTSLPPDDPDRPTMKRRSSDSAPGADSTTTTASTQTGTSPADDPDRPSMQRRTPGNATPDTASTSTDGSSPNDDPDRPTLKRRTPEDAKKAGNGGNNNGAVTGVGSLNDDPDRPNLHHGKPTSAMTETDLPKLAGLPPNLHQMVAVSDAANRDPHPFVLDWDDEAQHKEILEKMQGMARAQLASYGSSKTSAPATTAAATKKTPAAAAPAKSRRPTTPAPAPQPLLDEELKAYTLSYGGAATYVYSAHTEGTGAALHYVTIVAQADGLGEVKPVIQSVTDAAHLDRTPKMQFVDVVDADGSNRASLLFELRSQSVRQFALYRVIAVHPEQIFLTGTTQ